ncbi:hypothetical protein WJX82_008583 [Trebouxia sp. C0006]
MHDGYQWNLVTRSACSKGCQGPLLHTVRRYGALVRRFTGPSEEDQHASCLFQKKQNRYMYCAIDEAGSHVGSKSFRLVVGVYGQTGKDMLGSACSQPIRVMANNDIPQGACHVQLIVNVRRDWVGCQTKKSSQVSSQESLESPASEQVLPSWRAQHSQACIGLHGPQQDELPADLLNGVTQFNRNCLWRARITSIALWR